MQRRINSSRVSSIIGANMTKKLVTLASISKTSKGLNYGNPATTTFGSTEEDIIPSSENPAVPNASDETVTQIDDVLNPKPETSQTLSGTEASNSDQNTLNPQNSDATYGASPTSGQATIPTFSSPSSSSSSTLFVPTAATSQRNSNSASSGSSSSLQTSQTPTATQLIYFL
jgi:hypothetical protein